MLTGISIKKFTFSAREFWLLCQNIEKVEEMVDQPVGLLDSLLKPNSTDDSKRSAKRADKTTTQRQKKIPKTSVTVNEDSEWFLLYLLNLLLVIVYAFTVSSLNFSFLVVMVAAMHENSPEYFKKIQKRFKYNICETEPKLKNTTIENYA